MPSPSSQFQSSLPLPEKEALLRERLFESFEKGRVAQLTLVAAPAGYGKTTALAQWASHLPHPVAWIGLGRRHNQPRELWRALLQSLRGWGELSASSGIARLTAMLDWQQLPDSEILLDLLLEDLHQLEGTYVLILDEWQQIEQAEAEQWLKALLGRLPRPIHVYLGTRSRPAFLPLARLKAARELVEVGMAELSFTSAEMAAVLGPQAEADGPCLMRQTQGWPLGVQLLRLACGEDELADGVSTESELSDYLLDEILLQLPAAMQRFLLMTANLPRFNPSLATELCAAGQIEGDGSHLLQEARRRNLFLQTRDGEWYSYHPVFARLLQERQKTLPAAERALLAQKASAWYQAQGMAAEAIETAMAAEQPLAALASLNQLVPGMVLRGEIAPVLTWLAQLPEAEILNAPRLCVYHGCALVQAGRLQEAEFWIAQARERYAGDGSEDSLLNQLANIETTLAQARGDKQAMLAKSEAALNPAFGKDPEATGIAWFNRGMVCLLHQRLTEAEAAFGHAARLMPEGGDPLHGIDAACWHGRLALWRGELALARGRFESLIAQASHQGLANLDSIQLARLGLAEILLVHGEYAALDRQLASLENQALQKGPLRLRAAWLRWQANQRGLALQLLETGSRDEAAELLRALIREDRAGLAQALPPIEARLKRELGASQHLSLWMLIQALLQDQQQAAAQSWLKRWRKALDGTGAGHLTLLAELLLPEAKNLQAGLTLAAEESYVWPFIGWVPPAMLQQALAEAPKAYAQRLKALLPQQSTLLSPRELEILRLMQAGVANQGIADSLVVSLNTIKTHTKHIYEKLGVASRAQALMKAIETGLI